MSLNLKNDGNVVSHISLRERTTQNMVNRLYIGYTLQKRTKKIANNKNLMTTKGLMDICLLSKNKPSLHETFIMKKLVYFK